MPRSNRKLRKTKEQADGGDCFIAAAHLLIESDLFDSDAVLAHGVVVGTGGAVLGMRFVHAWVEWRGMAFDCSNGGQVMAPLEMYYGAGSIDAAKVQRYSRHDTMLRLLKAQNYGPWHDFGVYL